MKQGYAAELLKVSQSTISRWESGELDPDADHRSRIENLIRANSSFDADAALKRLILTSSQAVHLVCDATHELLVASPARSASWRIDPADFVGRSLWRFASPEIQQAEVAIEGLGWFEQPFQSYRFETSHNHSDEIPVYPSLMQWETLPLSDGRIGRLTTTL